MDPFNQPAGYEDGAFYCDPPEEDCLEISETHPNAIISQGEKFKVTKWVNKSGFGAYGKTVEEATRRADALSRWDMDEYRRRDDEAPVQ